MESKRDRKPTPLEEALKARLLSLCAHLPEFTTEVNDFGHTTFRVNNKPFIWLRGPEEISICVKTDKLTQGQLIRSDHWAKMPYLGQHGWITQDIAEVSEVDWEEMEERVEDSYWRAAPKRLIKQMKL